MVPRSAGLDVTLVSTFTIVPACSAQIKQVQKAVPLHLTILSLSQSAASLGPQHVNTWQQNYSQLRLCIWPQIAGGEGESELESRSNSTHSATKVMTEKTS